MRGSADSVAFPAAELSTMSIEAFLHACTVTDPVAMRATLDRASERLGLGGCVDEVLLPAMRRVGLWWERGYGDLEAERLTTATVRAWLDSKIAAAPAPREGNPVVLACGPSDLHTLGLEALAMLLRQRRQTYRLLGARTSIRSLSTAVVVNAPYAVVVVSHLPTGRLAATQSLRALAKLGPVLFYAGGAFASARLRRHVPGSYLGTDLRHACAVVLSAAGGAVAPAGRSRAGKV